MKMITRNGLINRVLKRCRTRVDRSLVDIYLKINGVCKLYELPDSELFDLAEDLRR